MAQRGSCDILLQFPKELEETVVKQIHHSRLRKDDLITQIHGSLKPSGLKPADSGKENGTLPTGTPGAPPVTKKLLGLFLVYVSIEHPRCLCLFL